MEMNYEEYLSHFFNEIAKISNEKASIRNCLKIKVLTDVISSIYLIMGLKKGQWIIQNGVRRESCEKKKKEKGFTQICQFEKAKNNHTINTRW